MSELSAEEVEAIVLSTGELASGSVRVASARVIDRIGQQRVAIVVIAARIERCNGGRNITTGRVCLAVRRDGQTLSVVRVYDREVERLSAALHVARREVA